jgi:hypothetical protein
MSALPPIADIGTQSWNVRFVPKADIMQLEEGLKRREARVVIGGLPPKEGPLSDENEMPESQ